MKRLFKHLTVALITVFTLTACDSLLPGIKRRSSKDDESSLVSSKKPQGKAPDYEIVGDSNGPFVIAVNEPITTRFYLWDETNHAKVKISDESHASCSNSGLEVTSETYYSDIGVTLNANTAGTYSFDVVLVTTEGYSYERSFAVEAQDGSGACYLATESSFTVTLNNSIYLEARIYNIRNNSYLDIDRSEPLRINSYGPEIAITDYFLTNDTTLVLQINGIAIGEGALSINVYSSSGVAYGKTINYRVKGERGNYKLTSETNPIIVETGSSGIFNFNLLNGNGDVVEMQTGYYRLSGLNNDFTYSLVELTSGNIKIQFNNINQAGGFSDFSLTVRSADGNEYTEYFKVYSRYYYENVLTMEFDLTGAGSNRLCLTIRAPHVDGSLATITYVYIRARYGIVCDPTTVENLNVTEYKHYFTLKAHGDDVIDVDVGTSESIWVSSGFYVSL